MAAAASKIAGLGQRRRGTGQPWSGKTALDRQTLRVLETWTWTVVQQQQLAVFLPVKQLMPTWMQLVASPAAVACHVLPCSVIALMRRDVGHSGPLTSFLSGTMRKCNRPCH
jgi:hypothetical protein